MSSEWEDGDNFKKDGILEGTKKWVFMDDAR